MSAVRPCSTIPSALHHADPVGDPAHDGQVVGDEQQAQPLARLQVGQQIQDLRLDRHIQRRCRLVRDQQVRPVRQRHGDHHALPLPARKLVRIGAQPAFRVADADLRHQVQDARPRRLAAQALVQRQAFGQLPLDRVQRVQACHRLLEDEADAVAAHPAQRRARCADHLGAVVAHRSRDLGAVGQQRHRGQRGHRLAGPAFAHQRQRLALARRQS